MMAIEFKITKEQILLIERKIRRQMAKENGYYDGRMRNCVFKNKKKEKNKRKCREKVGY